MADTNGLPDLLERTSEERGQEIFYRFSNGLEIKTEIYLKRDPRSESGSRAALERPSSPNHRPHYNEPDTDTAPAQANPGNAGTRRQ